MGKDSEYEKPKLSRENLENHGIVYDDDIYVSPSDFQNDADGSDSSETGFDGSDLDPDENDSGFEGEDSDDADPREDGDSTQGDELIELPYHVNALRKALLCFGAPVPKLKRKDLEEERDLFMERRHSKSTKKKKRAWHAAETAPDEDLSCEPPFSAYGRTDKPKVTTRQNREYTEIQEIADKAKKRVRALVGEDDWTGFLVSNVFKHFEPDLDSRDLTMNDHDRRIITDYDRRMGHLFDEYCLCRNAPWVEKREWEDNQPDPNPSQPKPDLTYAFKMFTPDAKLPQGFADYNYAKNLSCEYLGHLRGNGLRSAPKTGLNKAFKGDRDYNGLDESDLMCFPWAVVELKRISAKTADAGHCYCQAVNGAATALSILEQLFEMAEGSLPEDLPPVIAFTCVGVNARVWLAYLDSHPVYKTKRWRMTCIWATNLTLTWGVWSLQLIVRNMHIWASRILRPRLSQCLTLIRLKSHIAPPSDLKPSPSSKQQRPALKARILPSQTDDHVPSTPRDFPVGLPGSDTFSRRASVVDQARTYHSKDHSKKDWPDDSADELPNLLNQVDLDAQDSDGRDDGEGLDGKSLKSRHANRKSVNKYDNSSDLSDHSGEFDHDGNSLVQKSGRRARKGAVDEGDDEDSEEHSDSVKYDIRSMRHLPMLILEGYELTQFDYFKILLRKSSDGQLMNAIWETILRRRPGEVIPHIRTWLRNDCWDRQHKQDIKAVRDSLNAALSEAPPPANAFKITLEGNLHQSFLIMQALQHLQDTAQSRELRKIYLNLLRCYDGRNYQSADWYDVLLAGDFNKHPVWDLVELEARIEVKRLGQISPTDAWPNDESYEVEKIVDHSEDDGEVSFRLRWAGEGKQDDSWIADGEGELEACQKKLKEYVERVTVRRHSKLIQ